MSRTQDRKSGIPRHTGTEKTPCSGHSLRKRTEGIPSSAGSSTYSAGMRRKQTGQTLSVACGRERAGASSGLRHVDPVLGAQIDKFVPTLGEQIPAQGHVSAAARFFLNRWAGNIPASSGAYMLGKPRRIVVDQRFRHRMGGFTRGPFARQIPERAAPPVKSPHAPPLCPIP